MTWRIAFFLLVFAVAVPAAVPEFQAQPQDVVDAAALQHSNAGVQQANMGRYREAIRSFQQAIALAPHFSEAYYNLGLSHLQLQQFDAAAKAFVGAVQVRANYGEAWYQLGIALQAQQHYEMAGQAFLSALSSIGRSPHLLYRLGLVFLRQKNWEQAATYWDELVEGYPDHPAALSLHPHQPALYFNLGTVRYVKGDLAGAEDALDRARRLKPGYFEAVYNLGLVYRDLDRYDDAVRMLTKARTLQPDNLEVQEVLGGVYVLQGHLDMAESLFRQVLKDHPGRLDPHRGLVKVMLRRGRTNDALVDALNVVANAPSDPASFMLLAFVYEHNADGERYGSGARADLAVNAYRRALALDSTRVATHFNLGILYGRMGEWKRALDALKHAQSIDPAHPGVQKWLPDIEARYRATIDNEQ
jgi:tetratricopeptide (TPR) repeat protein